MVKRRSYLLIPLLETQMSFPVWKHSWVSKVIACLIMRVITDRMILMDLLTKQSREINFLWLAASLLGNGNGGLLVQDLGGGSKRGGATHTESYNTQTTPHMDNALKTLKTRTWRIVSMVYQMKILMVQMGIRVQILKHQMGNPMKILITQAFCPHLLRWRVRKCCSHLQKPQAMMRCSVRKSHIHHPQPL
jgi:hypothetical protein